MGTRLLQRAGGPPPPCGGASLGSKDQSRLALFHLEFCFLWTEVFGVRERLERRHITGALSSGRVSEEHCCVTFLPACPPKGVQGWHPFDQLRSEVGCRLCAVLSAASSRAVLQRGRPVSIRAEQWIRARTCEPPQSPETQIDPLGACCSWELGLSLLPTWWHF